jgi:hypothetical protein
MVRIHLPPAAECAANLTFGDVLTHYLSSPTQELKTVITNLVVLIGIGEAQCLAAGCSGSRAAPWSSRLALREGRDGIPRRRRNVG